MSLAAVAEARNRPLDCGGIQPHPLQWHKLKLVMWQVEVTSECCAAYCGWRHVTDALSETAVTVIAFDRLWAALIKAGIWNWIIATCISEKTQYQQNFT